jgi:hypothetical protein
VLTLLRHGPRPARTELVKTFVLALAAELAVRLLPLPRAARAFGASVDVSDSPASVSSDVTLLPAWAQRKVAYVVLVMDAWPGDGLCLRRSLVLARRLRALAPRLDIGVRSDAGSVRAHAWIVVGGVAIEPGNYQRLRDPRRRVA